MKKIILSTIIASLITISCTKNNENTSEIKKSTNATVEIDPKNVDHLKYAIYTVLEDGKMVVGFSQLNLKELYDSKVNKKTIDLKLPNQLFYLGIYPAKEGIFPDLAKYQIGAINYTWLVFNTDLSISLRATEKYTATHVIINSTIPPIELGYYNIHINNYITDSLVSGNFDGVMAKIDLETKRPDITATPLTVRGSFENAGYIDYEKVKDLIPIDLHSILR